MKRRITIDIPPSPGLLQRLLTVIGREVEWTRSTVMTFAEPEACPTCEGQGCERCFTTGRRHLCKLYVHPTTAGRATVALWQGAPGTMQPVAETATDRDVADITIDAMLACLQNGGLIINDRRPR